MKGYAALGIGKHGWIDVEKPQIGPLDAVVRPIAVAPCSSDTHCMHGGAGELNGVILGHEAVGEVVEVGGLVKSFKPGDIVVVPCVTPDWMQVSMQERKANTAHDCGLMGSFKFVLSQHGVFAEFFSVVEADANLVHMPKDVSIEDALMTVDMASTGFYGAELADVQYGDTVVVFGIGPVGLMAITGAKLRGAGKIIAIGTRENCSDLAKEYGATEIVNYKDGDVVEKIKSITTKVDKVILAGGKASALNQALALVRPNGVIANINFIDVTDEYSFPAFSWGLGMSDVSLRCGMCPGGAYRIQQLLDMIAADRFHPGTMLNYKFNGFDKIKDAFIAMDESLQID
jgi:threonine dehydrogenase-like Zn-dependent dehydrogenase